MLKKILVSLICLIINVITTSSVYGDCASLQGRWEGSYTIKPRVFGFSVGMCQYSTVMDVNGTNNGKYATTVTMTKTGGKGRANKKCSQTMQIKATMVCTNDSIRFLTEESAIGRQDVELARAGQTLNSEGKFKMKQGRHNVKAEYTWGITKQSI